jgi:hypothetical protein
LIGHAGSRNLKHFVETSTTCKVNFFVNTDWELPIALETTIWPTVLIHVLPGVVYDAGVSRNRFRFNEALLNDFDI